MTEKEYVQEWFDYLEREWDEKVVMNNYSHESMNRNAESGKFTVRVEGIFAGLRDIYGTFGVPEMANVFMDLEDCRYDFSIRAFVYDEGWQTSVYFPSGRVRSFCETNGAV